MTSNFLEKVNIWYRYCQNFYGDCKSAFFDFQKNFSDVFFKKIITVLKVDCMNLDRKSGTTWIAQFIIPFEFQFIILNHGGCYSSQLLINLNHLNKFHFVLIKNYNFLCMTHKLCVMRFTSSVVFDWFQILSIKMN